ncbi:hypothetical protein OIDMADRAFT_148287 [Oidiodendron maius Zn]|uniref:Uncharacterized protein n=1 Tax=Oidiodendron maius (strain Zn) TaxID=913774 RepID=A0A0C3GJV6_OIDMZ|nr:hypothetical protein OIDMADRAFT_148287 [Oidiodendron maius Zn]
MENLSWLRNKTGAIARNDHAAVSALLNLRVCGSAHLSGSLMRQLQIWKEKKPDIGILILTSILIFIYMAMIIPKFYHTYPATHPGIERGIDRTPHLLMPILPIRRKQICGFNAPNSAKLKDLDQAKLGNVDEDVECADDMWSIERSIDQENSPTQLLINLYLPDSLKIQPKALKSSK